MRSCRRLARGLLAAGALALVETGTATAQRADPNVVRQGETTLSSQPGYVRKPAYDKPLKAGAIVRGSRNVAAAWFSEASRVYRHDPFDTGEHATTLTVSTPGRRVFRLKLPDKTVFEDLTPRLADIDGDGTDEVIVVKANVHKGASLAVVKVLVNGIVMLAETPPIGTPFRWLNPAGVADFNGDGRPDIAIVVTPHIGGILQIWTLRGGRFELLAQTEGLSNHEMGSRHLGLSAVADFDGDGIPDIAIPDQSRRVLKFLTMKGEELVELGEAWLKAPAQQNFEVELVGGRPAVRVGLAGGRTQVISPCRDIQDWTMAKGTC